MTPPLANNVRSRPMSPVATHYRRRSASPDVGRGSVVASIEGPNGPFSPSQTRQQRGDPTRTWPTPPSNYANAREVQRQPQLIDLTSSQESVYQPRRTNETFDNPFRRREEEVYSRNVPSAQSTYSYPERRLVEVEPRVGDRQVREFVYSQQQPRYRDMQDIGSSATRRILIPEDETYRRNLFEDRAPVTQYRVPEPMDGPNEYARAETRMRPLSPPRRVLEELPAERHSLQPYAAGSQTSTRMLYTAPPPPSQDRR
jgi:hypothetical protein